MKLEEKIAEMLRAAAGWREYDAPDECETTEAAMLWRICRALEGAGYERNPATPDIYAGAAKLTWAAPTHEGNAWVAEIPGDMGLFACREYRDGWHCWFSRDEEFAHTPIIREDGSNEFPTLEAAQQACQSDFASRITSALSSLCVGVNWDDIESECLDEARSCAEGFAFDFDNIKSAISSCLNIRTEEEVRAEAAYPFQLLICGGEDAPGHASTLTVEEAERVLKEREDQARAEGAREERERLRGPCGWLIADPDAMDESSWTIELDPARQDGIVSIPLHIHPGHAAKFDALMESAGTKRPYHEVLSAALASQSNKEG